MTVTFGEKHGKKTYVYVDKEFKGALYPKELLEYGLEDDGEITPEILDRMMQDSLLLRAKRYVMNLLMKSDRTETELKRKLKENGYCEETAEEAIEYVKSFHYIDELRSAECFIRGKMESSSEKEIRYKLSEKGIDDETIDMAYDQIISGMDPDENPEYLSNTELKAAESFLKKKLGPKVHEEITYDEKQKIMASAFRKGFRQDSIRTAMRNILEN